MGPGWKRMSASPPPQLPPVPDVLPVVTNGLTPSLATPPTPHMAPPVALVAAAHAVTVDGLSIGTPTSSHARDCNPSCSHTQHKECCLRFRVPTVAVGSPQ